MIKRSKTISITIPEWVGSHHGRIEFGASTSVIVKVRESTVGMVKERSTTAQAIIKTIGRPVIMIARSCTSTNKQLGIGWLVAKRVFLTAPTQFLNFYHLEISPVLGRLFFLMKPESKRASPLTVTASGTMPIGSQILRTYGIGIPSRTAPKLASSLFP